jgi:hypothetical protein
MLRLYELLLSLYPPGFRLEFASEMQFVFTQAICDAGRLGWWRALSFFFQELVDLPRNLLWAYWHEARHKSGKHSMETTPETFQSTSRLSEPEPVSWNEAVLAGTPALIFPVAYLLPILVYWLLPPSSQTVFNIISALLVFGLLVVGVTWAWKAGFPRWSGGWVAWGWVVLLVLPGLLLQIWGQPLGYALSQFYMSVVLFTALALLLYRLMCKDPIKGILAALPLMNLFWLPHLEFVPELRKGIVLLVTWLIIALVSMLIMKLGRASAAVGLVLLATFLVALPYTYAANYLRVFSPDTPAEVIGHRADFSDLTSYFAPTLVGCFALLLGPLLLYELWKLSKGPGIARRIGFRLAFSGLFLSLIGNLSSMWFYENGKYALWYQAIPGSGWQSRADFLYFLNRLSPVFFTGLAYFGIALYIIGSLWVVSTSRHVLGKPTLSVSILLVLIPALLPVLTMYPAWFGLVEVPPQVPFGFLHPERFRYLAYLVSLITLGAAMWLAAQLGQRETKIS